MKSAILKFVAIAALQVVSIAAAQAQAPAGPNRPARVPQSYVITPFGYYHPSCVHHLEEGDEIRPDVLAIHHANKAPTPIISCAYPHYRADGLAVFGDERPSQHPKPPTIGHSWIVSAQCVTTPSSPQNCGTTAPSFGFLSAQWTVPPNPPSNDGQTLLYFPGLQDLNQTTPSTILQPVLGWNQDFASAWSIASWNCCVNGTVQESTPQLVSPGDTILGYMFNNCAPGTVSCSQWVVNALDLRTGQNSTLNRSSSFNQTFNWAFGGVLEVHNVTQCSDYPDSTTGLNGGTHSISFNAIRLYDDKMNLIPNPNWSIVNNVGAGATPQCSYGGSLPTEVKLNY
jgi:hypothetical protein